MQCATSFSTAVVIHNDRKVLRSAFGPPQDDIAIRDMTLGRSLRSCHFRLCVEIVDLLLVALFDDASAQLERRR